MRWSECGITGSGAGDKEEGNMPSWRDERCESDVRDAAIQGGRV
jgi:hypothetical protein